MLSLLFIKPIVFGVGLLSEENSRYKANFPGKTSLFLTPRHHKCVMECNKILFAQKSH